MGNLLFCLEDDFILPFLTAHSVRPNTKQKHPIIDSKLEMTFACFVLFCFVFFFVIEPGIFLQFRQNRPRFSHRD